MVVGDAGLRLYLAACGDYFEGLGVRAAERVAEGVAGGDGAADVLAGSGILVEITGVRRAVEAHGGGLGVGHGHGGQNQGHDCQYWN